MLLLISDANILMDVEVGDLVAPMFSLGYQFAVPDVLYYEELEEQHAHLLDMGLPDSHVVGEERRTRSSVGANLCQAWAQRPRKMPNCIRSWACVLVEAAGFEPASESTLHTVLHT